MRLLFDTSVLVAGLVDSHSKHTTALSWLQQVKAKKISLIVSSHSLAECFAVLTRLPLSPRISPDIAYYLIHENIEKSAEIVSLSTKEYLATLKRMSALGPSGGIIYDALAIKAAEKAKANKVLTFNLRDFQRLSPESPDFILTP